MDQLFYSRILIHNLKDEDSFCLIYQWFKKFLIPPGGGGVNEYAGEEYQVVKRGREYQGCGEEYNVEIRISKIIFPIILRLLGRISSGEEGNGTEMFMLWKKIKRS